jgi:DNA topoisomerase-3
VPTEAGLFLSGVLKQADPALVDLGVTAQLECLLGDVVVGKQEMVSAIVCGVAERIISKLKKAPPRGTIRSSLTELRSATAPERFRRRLR